MRIEILEEAERDLIEGFHFYENQEPGLGLYFRTNLFSDIEVSRVTQVFIASLTNRITGYYAESFPLQSSTRSKTKRFSFMRFWTAEKIRLGFGIDLSNLDC